MGALPSTFFLFLFFLLLDLFSLFVQAKPSYRDTYCKTQSYSSKCAPPLSFPSSSKPPASPQPKSTTPPSYTQISTHASPRLRIQSAAAHSLALPPHSRISRA